MRSIIEFLKRLFCLGTKEPTTSDTIVWKEKEYEIMEAVNDYRESKGLNRLLPEDTNYKEAEIRCDYCINHGTITHDNLSETRSRMYEKGFDTISENLAVMFKKCIYAHKSMETK